MTGWPHQGNEHELGQTLGDGEGQGSLASCSPQGHKELDTTERQRNSSREMEKGGKKKKKNIMSFFQTLKKTVEKFLSLMK